MGISADLIECNKNINNPKEVYNYIDNKEICHIGSGSSFKKELLKDYDNNQGCFTFKNGWEHLTEEAKDEITIYLENKYKIEIKYLLNKLNWFIILNY
jgi:hypothetical protein